MACSIFKIISNINTNIGVFVRYGHHLRGKPPGVARTLKQRLDELNYKDSSLYYCVDIGLPPKQINKVKEREERLRLLKKLRQDAELEKLSRQQKLTIDLNNVYNEWNETIGQNHIKDIADHYGVYEHLFGDAYFYPRIPLQVHFQYGTLDYPVYFGNVIKPSKAHIKPHVSYDSDDNVLWTLILTNPDGHFTEQNQEYVHWFLGNIPGNKINNGESIIEYLQPFPPKGTGYHRYIFILYKQEKKLDFSKFKKDGSCLDLSERTFNTLDFYKDNQDDLTPGGLAFFQSDWDPSLTDFYHNVLQMKEPIFEYDFPLPYVKKQEWFPKKKAFNLYMDRYRDPKQINKEFLMRKLKKVHPFNGPPSPLPYPNAQYFDGYKPTWLKLEIRKSRLKWGRINEIE